MRTTKLCRNHISRLVKAIKKHLYFDYKCFILSVFYQ